MTVLTTLFAAAIATGLAAAEADPAAAAGGIEAAGPLHVIPVKHGYLRRDLGLDPQWEKIRRRRGDPPAPPPPHGFRSGGAPTYPPAGIIIYGEFPDYYGYRRNLRIFEFNPELLEGPGR